MCGWICGDHFVLHPELAPLGQFSLNQRNFYEWVGRSNTFDLPVPCYSTGIRELRQGRNVICMATDGLLEGHSGPLHDGPSLYQHFADGDSKEPMGLRQQIQSLLRSVHRAQGRDSATVTVWCYDNPRAATHPSG